MAVTRFERAALAAMIVTCLACVAVLASMGKLFPAMDDRTTWTTPEGMCDEEDSCAVDYEDGTWTVTQTIP